MTTVRLFYCKMDRSRYISHLDITRVFSRAIARTTIPVWYTEGFNPRIYMTFPLPISLGYEGVCESFDMKLVDDEFPLAAVTEQLNKTLPEGIRIVETALPQQKPDQIALADYLVELESSDPAQLGTQFAEFAAQPTIIVTKKSKKGEKQLDIKPLLSLVASECSDDTLSLTLRLAAGTTLNVSPALVLEAFCAHSGASGLYTTVHRTAVLTADGTVWR